MRRRVKGLLLSALGRRVRCELCGQALFTGLPIVWAGGVKVVGAEYALVRVDWDSMNRLVFRHAEADRCPALRADRPA